MISLASIACYQELALTADERPGIHIGNPICRIRSVVTTTMSDRLKWRPRAGLPGGAEVFGHPSPPTLCLFPGWPEPARWSAWRQACQ
jgi:hypothetical protein